RVTAELNAKIFARQFTRQQTASAERRWPKGRIKTDCRTVVQAAVDGDPHARSGTGTGRDVRFTCSNCCTRWAAGRMATSSSDGSPLPPSFKYGTGEAP